MILVGDDSSLAFGSIGESAGIEIVNWNIVDVAQEGGFGYTAATD